MSDLSRVPGPSSPLQGNSARLLAVVLVGVLVAVIKPWGSSTPDAAADASSAIPSASVAPSPSVLRIANYDPGVFGIHEPAPDWELWPAGYLVSFGFATRIDSLAAGTEASPTPSAPPPPSAPAASTAPVPADAQEPIWPATIVVSPGNHLALLAINTPLGYQVVKATLSRRGSTGRMTPVPTVRPPSPWPDHFTIIAMDDGNGRDPKESWPPGDYVVDLQFEPGAITRRVEILVEGPPFGGGTAPASPAAGVIRP
jgi:hypothetical protein